MAEWLIMLKPSRPAFMDDASEDETAAMREHFLYLRRLLGEGRVILAGPSLRPPFGIVVFEAETEEEARAVMGDDPSVRAGVQTAELHPFRTSLLRGRDGA